VLATKGSESVDLDGRTAAARNAAKLIARLTAELPGGDATSAQHELVVRAALLSVLAGDAEVAIVRGQAIDVSAYCTLANTQRRILSALGIARDPKLIEHNGSGHTTDPALADRLRNVWPQFHAEETARHYAEREHELFAALADDDKAPPENDDTAEEPKP
jgi:hypothetical protein